MAANEKLTLEVGVKGASAGGKELSNFEKALNSIGVSSKSLFKILGTTGLSAAFYSLGKATVSAAANFEQSQVAFTTMLGSVENANFLLGKLADFAKTTPFTLQGVEANAKQLLAMDIEATKLLPTLKFLGDISAGLNVPMERLALNFGQVAVQGKLTGRELRDFAIAGVPLLGELSQQLNKSKSEIQSMISKGKIGFAEVEKAFISMTSEGGKFNNLMINQSKTFNGMVSNLQDTIQLFLRNTGTDFLGFGKNVVQKLIDFTENQLPKISDVFLSVFSTSFDIVGNIGFNINKIWESLMSEFTRTTGQELSKSFSLFESFLNGAKSLLAGLEYVINTISDSIGGGATAFLQIVTGNYEKVDETISNTVKNIKQNNLKLASDLENIGAEMITSQQGISNTSLLTEESLKKLDSISFKKLVSSFKEIEGGGADAEKALKKQEKIIETQRKAIKKLTDEYRNSKTGIKKELEEINAAHKKNIDEINSKTREAQTELKELEEAFNVTQKEDSKSFAQEYVEQQQKIKDIEKEISDEKNKRISEDDLTESNLISARISNLEQSLSKEKAALESASLYLKELKISEKDFAIQIENDISIEKTRLKNTDLTNFLNDLKIRRKEELQKFENEKLLIEQKINSYQESLNRENFMHKLASARIEKRMTALSTHYEVLMQKNTNITQIELDKQIIYFNRLEDSARRAYQAAQLSANSKFNNKTSISGARANGGSVSSNSTYLVGERGPELFTPNISGNITPNNKIGGSTVINISGVFGSDAAEELGDMIISRLQRSIAI